VTILVSGKHLFLAHPTGLNGSGSMGEARRKKIAIKELAARRVEAVWACLGVLRPEMPLPDRKVLAEKVLDLCFERTEPPPPTIRISPAQVQEIVWRNLQCANRHCSMVLFSDEIAEELNEFFSQDE
jgi:hypothetical protein